MGARKLYLISQLQVSTHLQNPHSLEGAGISASKTLIVFLFVDASLSLRKERVLKLNVSSAYSKKVTYYLLKIEEFIY